MIILFVLTMHLLGFVTSIKAILETRTSQGAIAWGISLNTLPKALARAIVFIWRFQSDRPTSPKSYSDMNNDVVPDAKDSLIGLPKGCFASSRAKIHAQEETTDWEQKLVVILVS